MAASSYTSAIQSLYVAYFSRPADPAGLGYWADYVDSRGSLTDVIEGFSSSVEYTSLYGGQSSSELVSSLYQNLFGRPAEPAGLAHWVGLLDSGALDPAQASAVIQNEALGTDTLAASNKLQAALAFTDALDTPEEIAGYAGDGPASEGRGFLQGVTADESSLLRALEPAALASSVGLATGTYKPPEPTPQPPAPAPQPPAPDTTPPVVTTPQEIMPVVGQAASSIILSMSEAGTAYLVHASVPVARLSDITSAAANLWLAVPISEADTPTMADASSLLNGEYLLYGVDAADNFGVSNTHAVTKRPVFPASELPDQTNPPYQVENNIVVGTFAPESLNGSSGNDFIYGVSGNDTIHGNDGDDTLIGGSGGDELYGGLGDDLIIADSNTEAGTLYGGVGNDVIVGGIESDSILGGSGRDEIYGNSGDDDIQGGDGDDIIYGESGNDTIGGGSGDDALYGGLGNDSIQGGADDDWIFGGFGDDILYGDAGIDTIYGGEGRDLMYGGTGADILDPGGNDGDVVRYEDVKDSFLKDESGVASGFDQVVAYSSVGFDFSFISGTWNDVTSYQSSMESTAALSAADLSNEISDGFTGESGKITAGVARFSDRAFLVVDADGSGNITTESDIVIQLTGSNISSVDGLTQISGYFYLEYL